ncbi:MAG TPA: hypothetical protein VLB76_25370 [Thermoanaerobaculia bacterium]|jgi:hypothetical protein|nr:hypothetical protein [Thermoanaerobaculia bacterium]
MTSESETPAPDIESAAKAELRKIAEVLKDTRERLRAVQDSLPIAPDLGDDEMDTATELRSVIDCVLVDSISPALRDLLAAAAYSPKKKAGP